MLDVFTKVVAQSDKQGQLVSKTQIDALRATVQEGARRTDVVNRISSNSSAIVTNAARALFAEQHQLIAPGGNAYTNRRVSACLRDMDIVLRYVTYAVFLGDASVLDDRCLNGLRETYVALGVPSGSMASSTNNMQKAAIALAHALSGVTHGGCSSLLSDLACYSDRAASAFS